MNEQDEIDFVLCDGDSFETGERLPHGRSKLWQTKQRNSVKNCSRDSATNRFMFAGSPNMSPNRTIESMINEGDFVMLACDNHATRQLVNQRCAYSTLQNVVLISGGNDGVEEGLRGTYGNVQVYIKEDGQHRTAPLDRFHPEIASPADSMPDPQDCLQAAVSGTPQISLVNLAVAGAMCNAGMRLLMPVSGERMYDEVALDALDAVAVPHWLSGPRYLEK